MTGSVRLKRSSLAVVAVAAAAAVTVSPAVPAHGTCGLRGYAYTGLLSQRQGFGVRATVAALADPLVEHGHVAAWVGVGGPGQGPGGTDEWLQVGLNRVAGKAARLYYEVALPWAKASVNLRTKVATGHRFHVAVLEMAHWKNIWLVWVDGRPVSWPIFLPSSHGRLTPMAIAENWDGGSPACNRYQYRFRRVSIASSPGGSWTPFRRRHARVIQDPGHLLVPVPTGGFVALAAPPPPDYSAHARPSRGSGPARDQRVLEE